ncbi:MAG: 1-deoxy-D-xylulose-5-phosphate reductoisomerase, partial [Syntrophales bacterium]|nr:1-deoxy-D-xylulose-5-phosphate reductoisomerase [Syntrophales bacterium]
IAYALAYPDRIDPGVPALDFSTLTGLTFERPDEAKFPCLAMAFAAGKAGGDRPAVMNAANEVAVAAFLEGRVSFVDIASVIQEVLAAMKHLHSPTISDLIDADRRARTIAKNMIEEYKPLCSA